MTEKVKILILAAGLGKRMQSPTPKVLSGVNGKPMVRHLVESIKEVSKEKPIVIVGYGTEAIKTELGDSCSYVLQERQLGTGHAVASAQDACQDAEHIIVLYGDQPFITSKTIKNLIEKHLQSKAKITFATTELSDFEDWQKAFTGFARILRKDGKISGVREYKDASDEEKKIKEVNAGCYAFDAAWLWQNLEKIKNDNAQKEYYLTDLLKIAAEEGETIENIKIEPREALGANTKEELEILQKFSV